MNYWDILRMANIIKSNRSPTVPNAGKDVKQEKYSFIAGGSTKWSSLFGRRLFSRKVKNGFIVNLAITFLSIDQIELKACFHPRNRVYLNFYSCWTNSGRNSSIFQENEINYGMSKQLNVFHHWGKKTNYQATKHHGGRSLTHTS